jgi:hypothetical protein
MKYTHGLCQFVLVSRIVDYLAFGSRFENKNQSLEHRN